jgi:hypothetical protein
MLELFVIEYTAGSGLGIACNTLGMLVTITTYSLNVNENI